MSNMQQESSDIASIRHGITPNYLNVFTRTTPSSDDIERSPTSTAPMNAMTVDLENKGSISPGSPHLSKQSLESLPAPLYSLPAPPKRSLRQKLGFAVPLTIVGCILAALALAIGHCYFLKFIKGRRVIDEAYKNSYLYVAGKLNMEDIRRGALDQARIKTFNGAFPYLVKTFLALSLGASLTQVTWYHARRSSFSVGELSSLFALPATSALAKSPVILSRASVALVMAIGILGLAVVAIEAPSALKVQPEPRAQVNASVPTVNFRQDHEVGYFYNPNSTDSDSSVLPTWDVIVQRAMMNPEPPTWKRPDACNGASCLYGVQYTAPAVKCSPIASESILSAPPNNTNSSYYLLKDWDRSCEGWGTSDSQCPYLYNATASVRSVEEAIGFTIGQQTPLKLVVLYSPRLADGIPFSGAHANATPTGVECEFWNATYTANVTFSGQLMSASSVVSEYHSPLIADCSINNRSGSNQSEIANQAAIFWSFVDMLTGTVKVGTARTNDNQFQYTLSSKGNRAPYTTLFEAGILSNQSSTLPPEPFFNLSVQDLSSSVHYLMGQATLGFMNMELGEQLTPAWITSGFNAWAIDLHLLYIIYGVAIGCTILGGIVGLCCTWSNGTPSGSTFSDFLLATRSPSLDALLHQAPSARDVAHQQPLTPSQKKLRYKTFEHVHPDGSISLVPTFTIEGRP